MVGRVDGKVALVSGAATGIGEAVVRRLMAEGAKVVVADIDESRGAGVAAELNKAGNEAIFLLLDVTKEESWKNCISTIESKFGRLDTLVNNAGIAIVESVDERCAVIDGQPLDDLSERSGLDGLQHLRKVVAWEVGEHWARQLRVG